MLSVRTCIYSHLRKCVAEVMLAHRKHSIKVQDSLVKSVTLNKGGVGTNLLREVKCHWLLHLVTVSYCCSNFTLERCSQSGLSRARE